MSERCHNCDRETCRRGEPTPKPWPGTYDPGHSEFWKNAGEAHAARENECNAHTVNWRKRAKAAEADLTALRERMRWRDVREELPQEGAKVLAFTLDNSAETTWFERGRFETRDGKRFQHHYVTHWRPIDAPEPLPAAPEVQAVAEKPAAFRPTPEQMRMGVFSEADLDLDGVDL